MSQEEATSSSSSSQMLTAEIKDGRLQIVEVAPYEKSNEDAGKTLALTESSSSDREPLKFMQVLDPEKGVVQLDLLNLTLVRCEDGEESYRLVSNNEASESGAQVVSADSVCVLQSSDGEDHDNQDSYVMVEGDQGPVVFLQSSLQQINSQTKAATSKQNEKDTTKKKALTPAEILEKAKALQKAKKLLSQSCTRKGKRLGDLPPPHELLSSPNFKLFLYSCKLCSFKCNAIKELTAHKTAEHSGRGSKWRGGASGGPSKDGSTRGRYSSMLQCARCPYRGTLHSQLMKHVQEKHINEDTSNSNGIYLNSPEAEAADVLVCGACGFESASKPEFRTHIEEEHGVSA